MVTCPNCGNEVEPTARSCTQCGAQLDPNQHAHGDGTPADTGSGVASAGQRAGSQPGQYSTGQRGPDSPQNRQRRPPESGQAPPPRTEETSNTRRNLLLAGGALALAGGGWYFFLRDDGPDTSSPESTIRAYVSALDSQDIEAYNSVIHPDSPHLAQLSEGDLDVLSSVDYQINNIEIVEESSDRVEARVSFSAEGPNGSIEQTSLVELRTHNGGWRVYRDELDGTV